LFTVQIFAGRALPGSVLVRVVLVRQSLGQRVDGALEFGQVCVTNAERSLM
jgi:hypothetical protein